MSDNNINAYCAICNEGYHICNSCHNQKVFKPWRTVTDTIEHYKIYLAIHRYTVTKNKELAREELQKCDLTGLESFNPEIKSVIKEIMAGNEGTVEPVKVKTSYKKRKEYTEVKNEGINNDNE
ncbi:hypothetical protein AALB52_18275 [Lachnospiraceae bacterium 38-14]